MLRRLHLLRHAKSSWDDAALDDHERPLAPRGERALPGLRRHIEAAGLDPALVLCSTARRARLTLDGISAALSPGVETHTEADLYGASARELMARLNRVGDDVHEALVVGHNPGLEDLALGLAGSGKSSLRDRLAMKFPTGALVTLTFTGSWSELEPGVARLEAFVTPHDL